MARGLFTLIAVLSLLAGVLAAGVAVRSYWVHEYLGCETRDFPTASSLDRRIYSLNLSFGGLAVRYEREYFPGLPAAQWESYRKGVYTRRTAWFYYPDHHMAYPHAYDYPRSYVGSAAILPNYLAFAYHSRRLDTLGAGGAPDRLLGYHMVILPLWVLVAASLLLPARWVHLYCGRWRRQRLARQGHCPNCGYDLRAHQPGQQCPECGRLIGASDGRQGAAAVTTEAIDGRSSNGPAHQG